MMNIWRLKINLKYNTWDVRITKSLLDLWPCPNLPPRSECFLMEREKPLRDYVDVLKSAWKYLKNSVITDIHRDDIMQNAATARHREISKAPFHISFRIPNFIMQSVLQFRLQFCIHLCIIKLEGKRKFY